MGLETDMRDAQRDAEVLFRPDSAVAAKFKWNATTPTLPSAGVEYDVIVADTTTGSAFMIGALNSTLSLFVVGVKSDFTLGIPKQGDQALLNGALHRVAHVMTSHGDSGLHIELEAMTGKA